MLPIRLEIPSQKGELNVTVLGVGDMGRKVVERYPCPDIHETFSMMRSLSICDDSNNDFYKYFKNTDILFVIADIDDNTNNIIEYANLHQHTAENKEATILINVGNVDDMSKVKDLFTVVISCDNIDKVHRIVEMLMLDMHNGYVGLDIKEINWFIESSHAPRFCEICAISENQLMKYIIDVCKNIEKEKNDKCKVNMVLYVKVPMYHDLIELCSNIFDIFSDYSIHGDILDKDIITQISTHRDEKNETFLISLIYGIQRF